MKGERGGESFGMKIPSRHSVIKGDFASLGWDLTVIGLHYGELSTVGNAATGDPKLSD
jgi:hypothetical protein